MCRIPYLLTAVAVTALMLSPVWAASDDIVWPTYTLVQKPHDTILTCRQLHVVIDKVAADIHTLSLAQYRAEDALRQAYDRQSSEGRQQAGAFLNTGTTKAGFTYTAARDAIKESKQVAVARQGYLTDLLTSCKDTAPGAPAP